MRCIALNIRLCAYYVLEVLIFVCIYLQLDIHYVEELLSDGTSDAEAALVCHARREIALEIQEACNRLHWYLCEVRQDTHA